MSLNQKTETFASWNRERSSDELRSFIAGRLTRTALVAVSIDDFEAVA